MFTEYPTINGGILRSIAEYITNNSTTHYATYKHGGDTPHLTIHNRDTAVDNTTVVEFKA